MASMASDVVPGPLRFPSKFHQKFGILEENVIHFRKVREHLEVLDRPLGSYQAVEHSSEMRGKDTNEYKRAIGLLFH